MRFQMLGTIFAATVLSVATAAAQTDAREQMRFKNMADSGYQPGVGTRAEYQAGYRDGFRLAYREGFGR